MRLDGALAALALLVLSASGAPAVADGTVERSYTGASAPLAQAPCEAAEGLAGACFALPEGTDDIHLAAQDEINGAAALEWRIEGAAGQGYGSGVVCGSGWILEPDPEDFPVERLRVTVLAPGFAEHLCPPPASGTQGTITATFVSS